MTLKEMLLEQLQKDTQDLHNSWKTEADKHQARIEEIEGMTEEEIQEKMKSFQHFRGIIAYLLTKSEEVVNESAKRED